VPFLIALAVSICLTPVVARLASAVGLVDRPSDGLKIHRRPVPVVGGVVVVASLLSALAVVGERIPRSILAAVGVALLAGLVDDVRPMAPWVRIQVLAAAGVLLVAGGFRLSVLGPLGAVGLVALVVACANAVNITDGRNGLVGGLAAVGALGLATLLHGNPAGSALGFAFAGGLGGFLVFNATSGRIFLGNGGAYAIGVLLAAMSAQITMAQGWRGFLEAAACLSIFAFELGFTIVRRLLARRPLVHGDREHSYDLMADRLGDRPAVFTLWALGAASVGAAAVLAAVSLSLGIALIAVMTVGAVVAGSRLLRRVNA
jgi:UDP-GlcNAc:undecaprenyl-phosphate GlcNAc-1-phosphate transferase